MLLHQRIGVSDGPLLRRGVEAQRRQQIGHTGSGAVRRSAGKRVGIDVRRLPGNIGQRLGEERRVFAAAARDFNHKTRGRQHALEHTENRPAIAGDVRVVEPRIGYFRHFVCFP